MNEVKTRRVIALLSLAAIILLGGIALSPASPAAGASPKTIATTFVSLLARGDFAAAERYFSPRMKAAAPEARLRQVWDGLIAQLGSFRRQDGVSEAAVGGGENVAVSCIFAQGTADLLVSVDAAGKIAGFHLANLRQVTAYTPPSYVRPASFHEQQVTVGRAPWALPGTLTLPNGHGPFPAVVLVAGSGPDDRDETVEGDKPFRDIAWGLASKGIAVLRYDKRTLVYGARISALTRFTVQDEFVDDALAAVHLLGGTPGIDRHRIYLLGHSEGGMVAPRIARQDSRIAGLIIMAGPTRPLVDVIVGQYTYLHSRGLVGAAQLAAVRKQAARIKALTPADRGRATNLLGAPPAYWLDLRSYHPAAVAGTLSMPMLIMQAARDYQVTAADFKGWKAALAKHRHVSFQLYPNLFHPFIPVPSGSPPGLATPDAYNHPGHVAADVIQDLAAWLQANLPSASWARFRSTVNPYTILVPRSFRHTSSRGTDYFSLPLGGSNANLSVWTEPGHRAEKAGLLLRGEGARRVRAGGWMAIDGRRLPVMSGSFHGLAGSWTVQLVTFAACERVWTLSATYDVRNRLLRPLLLRMMRSVRLTCSPSLRGAV